MDASEKLYFEVPHGYTVGDLNREVEQSLQESEKEVAAILLKHSVPSEQATVIGQKVIQGAPQVAYDGSGSTVDVIAITVSLAPLIKVLTPLLQPFAERGSKLFYEVGHDVWAIIKQKMLDKNIRLTEKKNKSK